MINNSNIEIIFYTMFIFLMGALWGTSVLYAGRMANVRFSNAVFPTRPFLNGAHCGGCVLLIWLGFALYAYVVCRILSVSCTFSACLFIVTVSALPRYTIWLATPIRNVSHLMYLLFKKALVTSTILFVLILFFSFKTNFDLSYVQTVAVTVGIIFVFGMITRTELQFHPESLPALMPWQRYHIGTITLWYPRTLPSGLSNTLGTQANQIVKNIGRMLDVEIIHNKIDVFVFTDSKKHETANNAVGFQIDGTSCKNGCTVLYSNWKDTTEILAHEICHVVSFQYVAPYIPHLINEGLAMYVTYELLYSEEQMPACSFPVCHNR
jgi:hypothetical protein